MPLDQYSHDDDDHKGDTKRRKDFDCPECNANNPYDDGFAPGDEIRCFYCGMEFKVELTGEGRWKFREM
ncbi:MAG: hypothetical protein ACOX6T_11870 [Myxococcales bacterium]|jgi:transcription elongation factor Elf1